MPTNSCLGDVICIKCFGEKLSDKKYREKIKKDVASSICALANSNGGKVELRGKEAEGNFVSTSLLDSLTRTIEQSLISRLGAEITESMDIFENKHEKMIEITVHKARLFVTIKYNLYRPTQKQVEVVDNLPNALQIMNRKFVDQPVQLGSHRKEFFYGQDCDLGENDVIQFKHLKSDSSKRVTLADRMVGKSNKFNCYVSAFANHRGGHIYYGIDDHGVVRGEEIVEISKIEKKVEEAIKKIIWPDTIVQPYRAKHWGIFFEPVLDENSNPIPSTFVIVIFIAHCFGGVFTEKPESYEMVEGKVERMSFTTWKEKLQPVGLSMRKEEVPSTVKRISLSPAAKKRCTEANEILTETMNNGEWKSFTRYASRLEREYPKNPEVKLVVLTMRVMANCRQGYFHKASKLLTKYHEYFTRSELPFVFDKLFLCLKGWLEHMSDQFAEYRVISSNALTLAESIEPSIFTVAIYLIASICVLSQNDARFSPDILCKKALEHLKYVEGAPRSQADMNHTAHIILAAYQLGYDMSGNVIKKDVDKESFQTAKASIMAVNQSVCDGNPLTRYREIWLELTQSMLCMRHPQLEPEKQGICNKAALKYAKKAVAQAKESGLEEMTCWAQTTIASCTETLLLVELRRMENIKVFKAQQKV